MASVLSACRILLTASLAVLPAFAFGEPAEDIEGWVEGKLQTMTLREKIGQMIMVDLPGTELTPSLAAHFADGCFGGAIFFDYNLKDEEQTRLYIRQLQTQAVVNTGVPLLVAVDQEGGRVDRLGAMLDLKTTTKVSARTLGEVFAFSPARSGSALGHAAGEIARRMHTLGFNMNLAPVLDLTGDRASYIYDRSYGNDPDLVSRVTSRFADAMESNGVIATGKHFPSLSVTHADSHRSLPVLGRSMAELQRHEFVPFRRLRDHLGAIMVGHVIVPDIDPKQPASISPKAIAALRQQVGWRGVIITDDLKMRALSDHYSLLEIVIRAVYADVDVLLVAWGKEKQQQTLDIIERAVKLGKIPPSRIDRSVRRILALKYRFAL